MAQQSVTTPTKRHLVVTVHGIMTYGDWQSRLEGLIRQQDPSIEIYNYTFGFFPFLAFLFPLSRYLVRRRFRNWLLETATTGGEVGRIDFVAHSFGTHVVGKTLKGLLGTHSAFLDKVDTVILSGSVLRSDFNWDRLLQGLPRLRVVNECSWRDKALILSQLFCVGTGMAGRVGFIGGVGPRFRNLFHDFGHSGYFEPQADHRVIQESDRDAFMRERWAPLLASSRIDRPIPDGPDHRPRLTTARKISMWLLNLASIPKILTYSLAALSIPLMFFYVDHQRRIQAERAEALRLFVLREEMVGVARLLPSLDNVVTRGKLRNFLMNMDGFGVGRSRELASDVKVLNDLSEVDPDLKHPEDFKEYVRLLTDHFDPEPDVAHALTRAMSEHWLCQNTTMPKEEYKRRRATVKARFEQVRAWSESRNYDSEKMFWRFVYGLVLIDRGETNQAVEHLEKARAAAIGNDPHTLWFRMQVHSALSQAYQPTDWTRAVREVDLAIDCAPDNYDRGKLILDRAWIYMAHFRFVEAERDFSKAASILQSVIDNEREFHAYLELFHARHGLNMVSFHRSREHGPGDADKAYERYTEMLKALREHVNHEDRLSIEDRVEFHERWMNSAERQGDVMMLMGTPIQDIRGGHFEKAESAYQQIEPYYHNHLEKHGSPTRTAWVARVLYKKAVATAMARKDRAEAARILHHAGELTRSIPDDSPDRGRGRFYEDLAKVCIGIAHPPALPARVQHEARQAEETVRRYLEESRNLRPERDDLEFLYLAAQLVDAHTATLSGRSRTERTTLANDVHELLGSHEEANATPPPSLVVGSREL